MLDCADSLAKPHPIVPDTLGLKASFTNPGDFGVQTFKPEEKA
jgi:hypothetical protein